MKTVPFIFNKKNIAEKAKHLKKYKIPKYQKSKLKCFEGVECFEK